MQYEQLSPNITEEMLHSWLDNELGRRESSVVGEHVQECCACAVLFDECRDLRTTVSKLLAAYDSELADTIRTARSARPKLTPHSHVSSAPSISYIAPVQPTSTVLANGAQVRVDGRARIDLRWYGVAGDGAWLSRGGWLNQHSRELLFVRHCRSNAKRVDCHWRCDHCVGTRNKGAVVRIRGTNLHAVTDPAGQFKIRGVPQLTTALETRGPIGYGTHIEFVNIEESLEPVVNIVLPAGVLALNPYVVTAENPISKTVTQTCLMSVELFTATDARMFQVLRGKIRTRGNFRLEVVDWPAQGINTSAHFTLESVGTLTGRVRDKTADLRDTLTRDGSVWRGSATEPRDHKTRWRRVSMRETVCAL